MSVVTVSNTNVWSEKLLFDSTVGAACPVY